MNIRIAQTGDKDRWDGFVNHHDEATPYHLMAWTSSIQKAYGFKNFNLIAENDDSVEGVMPISMLKIPFRKAALVALPYCDVGTILSRSIDVQKELLKEAISLAKKNNVSILDVRGEIAPIISQNYNKNIQTDFKKVRMLLELPESSDELWKSFKSKLRSQVRKAEKNNLSFKFGNNLLDEFYSVFCQNMRDLGSPVHSKRWFKEIINQYGNSAQIGIVYHENTAVGSGLILRTKSSISIPWASTLRKYNRLSPNMLLYWNFLKFAADNHCSSFDFGRSTPNEGTFKFKAQWGAHPKPLPWHTFYFKDLPAVSEQPTNSSSRLYAEKIWQKLPLKAANFLGSKLRKYISL